MKTDYYTCLWEVFKESARFLAPKFDNIKLLLDIKICEPIKLKRLAKFNYFLSTYHWSLGSGKVRCKDIKSLTYWLNALFFHPASINFFVSVSGLGTYIEWLIRLKMSSWSLLYLFFTNLSLTSWNINDCHLPCKVFLLHQVHLGQLEEGQHPVDDDLDLLSI